jgi:hypothetical protein
MTVEIPKSFTLPGGYRVKVKLVSFEKLQEIGADGPPDIASEEKVYAFFWDRGGKGDLYLLRGRHPLLLAMDFSHEIKHALAEWEDWWLRKHGVESVIEAEADRQIKEVEQ